MMISQSTANSKQALTNNCITSRQGEKQYKSSAISMITKVFHHIADSTNFDNVINSFEAKLIISS